MIQALWGSHSKNINKYEKIHIFSYLILIDVQRSFFTFHEPPSDACDIFQIEMRAMPLPLYQTNVKTSAHFN